MAFHHPVCLGGLCAESEDGIAGFFRYGTIGSGGCKIGKYKRQWGNEQRPTVLKKISPTALTRLVQIVGHELFTVPVNPRRNEIVGSPQGDEIYQGCPWPIYYSQ